MEQKEKLSNANTYLILGICSIILNIFIVGIFGIIGLACGIYCIIKIRKKRLLYSENSSKYTNYNIVNIGYVLSIIGLGLQLLAILWLTIFTANLAGNFFPNH